MNGHMERVGLLWRVEWDPVEEGQPIRETCRLHAMFAAFAACGVAAEPVVYSDETADAVREQLIGLDGVLVWVNPVENGHDRSKLDPLLRAVADDGVWVSAHPDVILRMATKQVIVDTAEMSWSPEVHLYDSHEQLARELPGRVAELGPLVLKQHRGQGGSGVWKVKVVSDRPSIVCVQHAAGEGTLEELAMNEFVDRCASYFLGGGLMVEQPFQPAWRKE